MFGAKAEEESRLINDSATKRTGQVSSVFEVGGRASRREQRAERSSSSPLQVFFVFAGAFFLSWAFSGGHDRHDDRQPNKKR